MASIELITAIGGGLITVCLSVIAYFTHRLIEQYDKFQDETRRTFKDVRSDHRETRDLVLNTRNEIYKKLESSGLDFDTRSKIQSLFSIVAKTQHEVQEKIIPAIEKTNENFGRVIVLEDRINDQESKLKTLFSIVTKAVGQKKP